VNSGLFLMEQVFSTPGWFSKPENEFFKAKLVFVKSKEL